ncbi:hypothetical protein [Sinorhizobium medicae]
MAPVKPPPMIATVGRGGVLAEGIHHIEDLLRSGDRVVVDL